MPDNEVKVRIVGENQAGAAIEQASQQLESLTAVGEKLMGVLELVGATEVISRLTEMAASAIETGANIAEMSERTGIGAEELEALSFAAQQSGVSTDQFEKGIRKLQVTLTQAAEGNAKAAAALAAVGVSARDSAGNVTSAGAALDAIAAKFKSTADGSAKAGLAVQIFGRSGTEMIPMLNQGSEGLDALKQRAQALGLVLSGEDLDAIHDVRKSMSELKDVTVALVENFVAGLAPALENISEALSEEFATQMGVAKEAGMGFNDILKLTVGLLDAVAIDAEWAGEKVVKSWTAMQDVATLNLSKAFHDAMQFTGIEDDPQAKAINDSFRKFWDALWPDKASQSGHAKAVTDELDVVGAKAKDETKELLEFQIASIKAGETALKAGYDAQKSELENLYKHNLVSVDDFYKQKKDLEQTSIQVEMYALEQEGKLYDQALEHLAGLNPAETARLRTALEQGNLDDAALSRMPKIKDNLSEIISLMTKQVQTATQLDTLQKKLQASQGLTPSGDVDTLARLADSEDVAAAKAKMLGEAIEQTFQKIKDETDIVKQEMENFDIDSIHGQQQLNNVLKQGTEQLKSMVAQYRQLAAASGEQSLIANGQKFETQIDQMTLKVHTLAQTLGQEGTKDLEDFFGGLEKNSGKASQEFIKFGESILQTLSQIVNKMIATYIMEKLIGSAMGIASGGGGGALSIGSDINPAPTSSSGVLGTVPGFEAGGRPDVGKPAIVGEEGPELFVPDVAGAVVPHGKSVDTLVGAVLAAMPEMPEHDDMPIVGGEALFGRGGDVAGRLGEVLESLQTPAGPSRVAMPDLSAIIPHAMGGPLTAGEATEVGELGTELFVPDSAGTIVPHGRLGADLGGPSGVTQAINIDMRGADAALIDARVKTILYPAMDKLAASERVIARESKLRRV